MKKIVFLLGLLISVCATAQIEKVIPAKPVPQRLVNDFAGVLTADQKDGLERKLVAYDDSTSNQIAVVTIRTTGDYDIEEVALGILRKWGVGGVKNNGIVILAAIDDHKVWISTGYGLEGAVPDITAKSIIDNNITPNFRQDNYYRGFDDAVNSVIKAAAGEYKAPEGYNKRSSNGGPGIGKILLAIIVLVVIFSRFGGGGRGGFMSRRGGWLGPVIFSGGLGGGSGWSGGGGGGSGGGFSGFGGGSGGGGGAGGSW